MDEFLGFNIYLHDRGQFWPGLEMGELISDYWQTGDWPIVDPMCFQCTLCIPMIEKLVNVDDNFRSNALPGRVGLSYAKFLPRDTEWEGSFEEIWFVYWGWNTCQNYNTGPEKDPAEQGGHCLLWGDSSSWPVLNSGSQLLLPILRPQLGGKRGRLSLRLVQVPIFEQSDKSWSVF